MWWGEFTLPHSSESTSNLCICSIFLSVHLSKVLAAVVPQSKSTELCCSAAVVSRGKSIEIEAQRRHFIMTRGVFVTGHFRSMLFVRKNL